MNPAAEIKIKPQKGTKAQKEKKPKKEKRILEYYLPSKELLSKPAIAVGYAMRAVLCFLITASFCNFLFDSFDIITIGRGGVYLLSFVFVMLFSLMHRSAKWYWSGFGVTAAGLVGGIVLSGSPIGLLMGMFPAAWNTAMDALEKGGFQTLDRLSVQSGGVPIETLLAAFQVFLILTFSAVLFASVYRRVYLLPIFFCGTISMLPVFTYNITYSTIDFSVIIFTVCGILVLRYYDRVMKKQSVEKHKTALGGYMGFGAALLAAIVVLIPALTVKTEWEEIRGVNETMEIARTVLSSVLVGERPDWSELQNMGNMDSLGSRSTLATHRRFNGSQILEVYSGIDQPLYLRSWVALNYNDDTWSTASNNDRETFVDLFGDDFEPETITQHFFEIAAPESMEFSTNTEYADYTKYGFVSTLISVNVLNSSGNLLYLPARFDTEHGFLGYAGEKNGLNRPYGEEINHYYDGVITTGWLNLNKQYSTVAHLPIYRDTTFVSEMKNLLVQYEANMELISAFYLRSRMQGNYTYDDFTVEYSRRFRDDVDYSALEAFARLSVSEQTEYYMEYVDEADRYDRYVKAHYTEKLGSERVAELAAQIVKDRIQPKIYKTNVEHDIILGEVLLNGSTVYSLRSFEATYTAVMEVIKYLREECTYTLTPSQNKNSIISRGYNSVETFLFLTKEGYCVQYATAATFLLREMGIPVRYVEGYMVEGLEFDRDNPNRFQNYTQTVRDYNAHAWIEVYFDGIGWLTFEATAPYYDKMYSPFSGGGSQQPIDPPTTQPSDPIETLPEHESAPLQTGDTVVPPLPIFGIMTKGQAIIAGSALGAAAVLTVIILLVRARVNRRRYRIAERTKKVQRALSDDAINQAEINELARYVTDLIMKTGIAGGLERGPQEYPADYARRIDTSLAALENVPVLRYRFEQIVPVMEKAVYGRQIEREELVMLAEFWLSLRDRVCERFNPFERYYYGTVKEMV